MLKSHLKIFGEILDEKVLISKYNINEKTVLEMY